MIKLFENEVYLINGETLCQSAQEAERLTGAPLDRAAARQGTMAYGILEKHNTSGDMEKLALRVDSLTSHDISYVGIIQSARASGLERFDIPYVLTNCHNSLCAVGGTINEDDHKFAMSVCKKYGGIFVPPNMANLHSYNREMMAACGKMIMGSDSHTRYGALGAMAFGEGGGEMVKQLLGKTYNIAMPEVIAVYLTGSPRPGVGPHDVAIAIIGAVYKKGFVKNRVMEFVGPGIASLPAEYRSAIDVMTTETTCLSSVWATDEETKNYYALHGRPEAYSKMAPAPVALYSGCVYVDLSAVECMIAMPMHPSNAYTIRELKENAADILHLVSEEMNKQISGASLDLMSKLRGGHIMIDQGEIAGCSGGTFDNVCAAADILKGRSCGAFGLNIYPGSLPAYAQLVKNGVFSELISAGAVIRECFCGPCFGSVDCPANGELSIRHTTRNFPNREGSKPAEGQMSAVALMDSRSIAATAASGGKLTAATELEVKYTARPYYFDGDIYKKRVYNGWGKPRPDAELLLGPGIKDWPEMPALTGDLLIKLCSYITDPVTTTDELIPSGETASYRSNPEKISEFALSRRDPQYVGRCRQVQALESSRKNGVLPSEVSRVYDALAKAGLDCDRLGTYIGSSIFAVCPGDGSAREQAASCQRVLGACANIVTAFATRRYRSNCINWGMLPLVIEEPAKIAPGDYVFIKNARAALLDGAVGFEAYVVGGDLCVTELNLSVGELTDEERRIIAAGCLINYYRNN